MTVPPPDEATAILLALILLVLIVIAVGIWRKPTRTGSTALLRNTDKDDNPGRLALDVASIRRVLIDVPFGAINDLAREVRLSNELLLDIAGYTERLPAPQPAIGPASLNVSRETPNPELDALAEKTERMSLAIAALIMGEHPTPENMTPDQAAAFARGIRYSANLVKSAMTNPEA